MLRVVQEVPNTGLEMRIPLKYIELRILHGEERSRGTSIERKCRHELLRARAADSWLECIPTWMEGHDVVENQLVYNLGAVSRTKKSEYLSDSSLVGSKTDARARVQGYRDLIFENDVGREIRVQYR